MAVDDTLSLYVEDPAGTRRIAADEALALRDYSFSSNLPADAPGGFATLDADVVLPDHPIPPLRSFAPVSLRHVDGTIAWEGRLAAQPEESDEGILTLSGVGHAAALRDDPSVVFLGVVSDTSLWEEPPAERFEQQSAGNRVLQEEFSANIAEGGIVMRMIADRNVATKNGGEVWFVSPAGQVIARVEYLASNSSSLNINQFLHVGPNLDGTSTVQHTITADLTVQTFTPSTTARYAYVQVDADGTVNKSTQYLLRLHRIALFGDHDLARHTVGTDLPDGLLFSDVIEHLVGLHASGIAVEATPSQAVSPNVYFPDPVDVGQVIEEAMAFEADRRAAVFEGPTLHYKPRQDFGRTWVVRRSEGARFVGVGPTSEPEHNAVVVFFSDDDGTPRRVGPPGSGADTEDASLEDSDPSNPVNAAGLYRPLLVEVPEPVRDAKAIELGQLALSEALRPRFAGEVELPRYAERDSERVPTTFLRAGDFIVDGDATESEPMQLIEASYARDSERPAVGTVDTPANRLDAALAGLGVRVRKFPRKRIERRLRKRRRRNRKIRKRAQKERNA